MNKSLFNYLLKSKKNLIVVISVIYTIVYVSCLVLFGYDSDSYKVAIVGISIVFGMLLYLLVPILYSFIHSKKAVDAYFSLPVSKKELLITIQIFIDAIVIIPFLILAIVNLVIGIVISNDFVLLSYILYVIFTIIAGACLILFNTAVFSLANSMFDGITMIIAYGVLPLFILLALNTFQNTLIAGLSPLDEEGIISFVSLPTAIVETDFNLMVITPPLKLIPLKTIVCLLWHFIASVLILKKHFINRQVERAESISNEFLSYPFVIYAYTFLLVFTLTENVFTERHLDSYILYVIVFICFGIANFVYHRKIKFRIKDVAFYLITIGISILFVFVASTTKGFGLSYKYEHNPSNIAFGYNQYKNKEEKQNEITKLIEKVNPNYYSYEIISNGYVSKNNMAKAKDILDLLETKRLAAIENHYSIGREYQGVYFRLNTNYDETKQGFELFEENRDYTNLCTYQYAPEMSIDELKILNKYSDVLIVISSVNGEYIELLLDELLTYEN